MRVNSEQEMLELGCQLAKRLALPAVIELVGDVGAGKTTFTRGLAAGLGVIEPVTSPSFTISKHYTFPTQTAIGELIHYDFYRLDDPGIMSDELADSLKQPNSVIVIEWGESVANLLPSTKYRLEIQQNNDGSREVLASKGSEKLDLLWKTCAKITENSGKSVEKHETICGKTEESL